MNLFKKKTVAYFSEIQYDLDEGETLHSILSQTRIDKRTAETMEGAMKIVYEKGVARKMFSIEDGDYMEENIRVKEKPISFRDYPVNDYRILLPSKDGIHQLGGRAPEGFIIPSGATNSPYVYLGYLNNQEKTLKWLPINKLHLICPIYGGFDVIYLDYSDPNVPRVLSEEGVQGYEAPEHKITKKSIIEFEATPMSLFKLKEDFIGSEYGNTGAPIWVQQNFIPKCPVSGNEMKFLLKLDPPHTIKVSNSDVDFRHENNPEYTEALNFGNGVLYIFIEPMYKTVAYFIQYT